MGGGMPLKEESREAEATGYSPSRSAWWLLLLGP